MFKVKAKHTKSTCVEYCVANTNTPGADGKVPYKNPYVLSSVVSDSFIPGCKVLTASLIINGRTILKTNL